MLEQLTKDARTHLDELRPAGTGFVSERRILQSALDFMSSKCDIGNIFALPVNVTGYSQIVKKKMALSNIRTKLKHGICGTLEAFGEDIQLIVENCKLYNGGDPYLLEHAERFLAGWKVFYSMADLLRKTDSVESTHAVAVTRTNTSSNTAENSSDSRNLPLELIPPESSNKRKRDTDELQDLPSTNSVNSNNAYSAAQQVTLSAESNSATTADVSNIVVEPGGSTAVTDASASSSASIANVAPTASVELTASLSLEQKLETLKFIVSNGDGSLKKDAMWKLMELVSK